MTIEQLLPMEIEHRSFEIIESELPHPLDEKLAPIIKRVIHTTADFDYADTLRFSQNVLTAAKSALESGQRIITDTNMAHSGINREALDKLQTEVICFMADTDIARMAQEQGITRAQAAMDKAALFGGQPIIAIGNAPTALIRLHELILAGRINPSLIIGVPVGFVNVVQAKELIMQSGVPYIVAVGRKGGSNVAAAIVNALMYMLTR